jgi:hypothetical protein
VTSPNDYLRNGRQWLGAIWRDLPVYSRALSSTGPDYLSLCNRGERLAAAPNGIGYRCDWQWTSDLHAPKVLPGLGLHLMQRALADYPVQRVAKRPDDQSSPDIAFLIGHRGLSRMPHLFATLESIAAQANVNVECIVVEQDHAAHLLGRLPGWVRYVHTPPAIPGMPFCRSWAFNVAARHAEASVLVLHDNDMLVPADYAESALRHVRDGFQVMNLKRFVFYLGQRHTEGVLRGGEALTARPPEVVTQNLEAGGSVVITAEGFKQIGGMDESFVGWGGEDNEFWERSQTLAVWPYGYLPIVHLWHPAQPAKHQIDNPALERYRALSATPATERIAELLRSNHAAMPGPELTSGQAE